MNVECAGAEMLWADLVKMLNLERDSNIPFLKLRNNEENTFRHI